MDTAQIELVMNFLYAEPPGTQHRAPAGTVVRTAQKSEESAP
jgi:hypothetical protein